MCFWAGATVAAGVAVGAGVVAANALPALMSATRLKVVNNFMGVSGRVADDCSERDSGIPRVSHPWRRG